MYISIYFQDLIKFDFKHKKYYFFTIKHNHSVSLRDTAHDIVKIIEYVGDIMSRSSIESMTYAFEVDSHERLHIHGICQSARSLQYNQLYRCWGVHHKFTQIFKVERTWTKMIQKIVFYITKQPTGPIINSLKVTEIIYGIPTDNCINNYAYWFEQ